MYTRLYVYRYLRLQSTHTFSKSQQNRDMHEPHIVSYFNFILLRVESPCGFHTRLVSVCTQVFFVVERAMLLLLWVCMYKVPSERLAGASIGFVRLVMVALFCVSVYAYWYAMFRSFFFTFFPYFYRHYFLIGFLKLQRGVFRSFCGQYRDVEYFSDRGLFW